MRLHVAGASRSHFIEQHLVEEDISKLQVSAENQGLVLLL
jgi:hypothetical protein